MVLTQDLPAKTRRAGLACGGFRKSKCRGQDSNPHGAFAPEDFKSCSWRTPSVTMGHIPRKRGRLSGRLPGIVARENRYSPIEQAKFRPSCSKSRAVANRFFSVVIGSPLAAIR